MTMPNNQIQNKAPEIVRRRRGCYDIWSFLGAATFVTLLTFSNGAISLFNGISDNTTGDCFILGLDIVEISVGTVIIFLSIAMLAICYSPLKESKITVLIAGYTFMLIPICLMVVLTAYMSTGKNNVWTEINIVELCSNFNTTVPFSGETVDQLRQDCFAESFKKLDFLICWVAIRTAFQALLAVVIGVWTYSHSSELTRKNKAPMHDKAAEPQNIPLPQQPTLPAQPTQTTTNPVNRTSIGSMFVNRRSNPPQYWEAGTSNHLNV